MPGKAHPHRYYHARVNRTLKFIIPPRKRILFIGSDAGEKLANLEPDIGLGIDDDSAYMRQAKRDFPQLDFASWDSSKPIPNKKFDFIVLNGAIGKSRDIPSLLGQLHQACHAATRLLVYQHNHLWQGILELLEWMHLKRREDIENWLSVTDVSAYLEASGFQVTRVFRRTVLPAWLFGLGTVINWLADLIPLLDSFKLDQYLIARPLPDVFPPPKKAPSLTICLTVRDEQKNILRIVKSLPQVAKDQEILFVEGHSKDGTREEIAKAARAYPKKNIRLLVQPGFGQGDAIKAGFAAAKGDVIILYEGDGTSNPQDLFYFYEAMSKRRFEFIEGSRFVYPLSVEAMPLLNKLGNIFFARWFTFLLGQNITDVLSGIKAIDKANFLTLNERWGFLGIQDPFGDFELLFGAARLGLKFGEVPMRYTPRLHGASKTRPLQHGWYLLRMAISGFILFRGE